MMSAALLFALLLPSFAPAGAGAAEGKQDLPGAKTFEKAAVKVAAVRPEKAEAKAGDVVKVAFDLEIPAKWHIYPVGKALFGKPTVFSFEGAEVAGAFEQPAPRIHEEKAVNLKYDYHEGKVTITVPLRFKSGEVKGRIDYQICDPNLCQDNSTPFTFKVALAAPSDDDAPPLKVLSVKPAKTEVQVGEVFTVAFEVEIPKDWHIYPTYKTNTGLLTEFKFKDAAVAGKIEEPRAKVKPAHALEPEYDYHEGRVTFLVPMRLNRGPQPGPFEAKGQIDYMICKETCEAADVPASFSLTVLPGEVAVMDPEYAERGFMGLILLGMLGGLVSLIMPCTYPLIPITLTYFIKQGAGSRSHGMVLSTLYSLGIILTFTGVGFAMSLALGAGGAREFAANPWVNIGVASLFLWFAGSLFGWYEIQLPFGLGSKLAGGQRKGAGGAFILGLLFAIVTFTCTIPIAATILSLAAGAHKLAALMAMLAYSVTMAIPFFLMGVFPGLIKEVPKSGGWLGTVKVSMGFVEIALAGFYFSKADQAWDIGILTRWIVLGVYVATCALVAVYLLGFFRTVPTAVRTVFALLFLGLGGFMAYGFTGKPLGLAETVVPPPPIHGTTLPAALAAAKKAGKPLFAEFTGVTWSNCLANRGTILVDPRVTELLDRYVIGELWTDRKNKMDEENNKLLNEKYGAALPLYVLFTPEGREVGRIGGRPSVETFVEFLKKGLAESGMGNGASGKKWSSANPRMETPIPGVFSCGDVLCNEAERAAAAALSAD